MTTQDTNNQAGGYVDREHEILIDTLLATKNREIEELRAELNEQCRIVGAGGERELRHQAVLRQALEALGEVLKYTPPHELEEWGVYAAILAINKALKEG